MAPMKKGDKGGGGPLYPDQLLPPGAPNLDGTLRKPADQMEQACEGLWDTGAAVKLPAPFSGTKGVPRTDLGEQRALSYAIERAFARPGGAAFAADIGVPPGRLRRIADKRDKIIQLDQAAQDLDSRLGTGQVLLTRSLAGDNELLIKHVQQEIDREKAAPGPSRWAAIDAHWAPVLRDKQDQVQKAVAGKHKLHKAHKPYAGQLMTAQEQQQTLAELGQLRDAARRTSRQAPVPAGTPEYPSRRAPRPRPRKAR